MPPIAPAVLDELRRIVGAAHVGTDPADLFAYSYDGTFQQRLPDAVVSPATTEEVAAVMAVADRAGLVVVARGASTSLAGGTIAIDGGLILNLARMNRILEIDPGNLCAVVQPGVVTGEFQAAVEAIGLFYPPDPASLSQSTLGGNVACCAGGPRGVKYGVTKDYVLGLTVVLPDGRVLRTGGKLTKNVTGYALTQLFVGSEGTLGVITEIILKLIPLPRGRSTALAIFPRLSAASETVTAIFLAGILPVTCELIDGLCINVIEDYQPLGLPRAAAALLILEQDGDPEVAARDVARIADLCRAHGASEVRVAADEAERAALWRARRAVSPALIRVRPNKLGEDIVVPRSAIPAMVAACRAIGDKYGLPIPVFGHAGDGNLHPNILFDRRNPDEVTRVELAAAEIFRAALALGGTLSGEHGIGSLKREFLEEDLGPLAVDLMRQLKAVFDPKGRLNPHKLFPERAGGAVPGFLTDLPALDATPCTPPEVGARM